MDTVLRVTGLVDMDQTSAALHHRLKQKDQTKILFRHAKTCKTNPISKTRCL